MSLQDRIRKLEGKDEGDCQLCGLAHPTIILSGETAPDKCPGCGGGLVVITVVSEEARGLVKRVMAGERTEKGVISEDQSS
jgi:hypothetical protein